MKNIYFVVLFSLCFLAIKSATLCPRDPTEGVDEQKTLDECKVIQVSEGMKACCLLDFKYNGMTGKTCYALTEAEVNNRQLAIDALKTQYQGSEGTIVCDGDKNNSSYIKFSLLSILLLLL